jgi:sodium/bile acid cotransporter 7
MNRRWGTWAEKNRITLKYFDQSVILIIVYTSFADSFLNKKFDLLNSSTLVLLTVSMVILFFVVYFIIKTICRLMKFSRENTITALFCGSKKSLVHGTVMSKVLFTAADPTGLILLPLMIYHAVQLMIASVIAGRFSKEHEQ